MKENRTLRVVVMLRRAAPGRGAGRAAQVRSVRESALAALRDVDAILERVGGRRVSKAPNALGYVTVETTPAGVRALTESDAVRGVVEDQPVRLAM